MKVLLSNDHYIMVLRASVCYFFFCCAYLDAGRADLRPRLPPRGMDYRRGLQHPVAMITAAVLRNSAATASPRAENNVLRDTASVLNFSLTTASRSLGNNGQPACPLSWTKEVDHIRDTPPAGRPILCIGLGQ